MFPQLTKFDTVIFSFLYSNAAVERKNEHKASLKQESLCSLLNTKLAFQRHGEVQAAAMDLPKSMLKLHFKMKSNADDKVAATLRQQFLSDMKEGKIQ